MSDNWVCIIPKEPNFVPGESAIRAAERRLSEMEPEAEDISSEVSDTIQFRDCGANMESIRCPTCSAEVPTDWWLEQMGDEDAWEDGFRLHPLSLPCGHTASSLNDLCYDFEQGFSRFILEAMNPNMTPLTSEQIAEFEALLGCPIKVIYQHI